ncbi:LodA/GoxA family CTQ-dependent oxidase [Roseivivax marinus]|uniref:LodA/GoxA family CTQ-dependent oxidase n=1 Tax=Roseivivax marinus TaxID=1379903 RepID=UPI001F04CE42|nr:LodA/GoxA family CTQ-dependent oxidase [Roseivivax marinus]UMA63320.1 LodA/GoxA family CTQ-dependent oxidase [Roseivivax marinus]
MAFRIHPAIGIARLGTSEEFYLAPETRAGEPQEGSSVNGGLPIRPGTEDETISSADIRDADGRLKRQGVRFRIFSYPDDQITSFPTGAGEEITIGSTVDGKTVTDIAWMAHLANKKANNWVSPDDVGVAAYENGGLPDLRNDGFDGESDPSAPVRLKKLIIDAGPRALSGANASVAFDTATEASFLKDGAITPLPDYPKQFPDDGSFPDRITPAGEDITTLGEARTDDKGRLIMLAAYGRSTGFDQFALPLNDDVNNDKWFDDTSDGPVTAVITFDDGSTAEVAPAWVVNTDPAYAPQTLNVVSLWDEQLNTFLQHFDLNPSIWTGDGFVADYSPDFASEIYPVFLAASLQMWNTNLPASAIAAHRSVGMITAEDDPQSRLYVKMLIRDPSDPDHASTGAPMMPLALGDSGKAFLTVTETQYFFLMQWFDGKFTSAPATPMGPGETLDMVSMANCLGGRFSPGIDMTFITRDPQLYDPDWTNPGVGPFRVRAAPIDYEAATSAPVLGIGYVPTRTDGAGVEPGDICKFMALPWHTDYNSCATHTPAPNPGGDIETPGAPGLFDGRNLSLFWSWPAQRPVAVYTFDDLVANGGALPEQRFSVRGAGTVAEAGQAGPFPAANVGRFQKREDILTHWHRIGVIMQGAAIEDYPEGANPDFYLEVASLLDGPDDPVAPWPNTVVDDPHG